MKDWLKNLVPCFALTLACMGVAGAFPFIILGLLPHEVGTMRPSEVADGLGGLTGALKFAPLMLFIAFLVASWVAAMSPFTSKRMAMNGNGDIVFLDPLIK